MLNTRKVRVPKKVYITTDGRGWYYLSAEEPKFDGWVWRSNVLLEGVLCRVGLRETFGEEVRKLERREFLELNLRTRQVTLWEAVEQEGEQKEGEE